MKADFRAHLEEEFEASARTTSPTRPTGWTGKLVGPEGRQRGRDDPRRGKTGVPMKQLKNRQEADTTFPTGSTRTARSSAFMDNRAKMIETGEGIDWATAEALAFGSLTRRATRCACPARMSSAARSRSAIRCSTTRRPRNATCRSNNVRRGPGAATRSSTRCCRKRRCSASSTATRWPSRTR
jgi:hypothetical protein